MLFGFSQRKNVNAADELLHVMGLTLRNWLSGQLLAMVVVGILTAIALTIIGLPLVLALALIATALAFLPFIGPILSAVPAILVALVDSPIKAVYVIIAYSIVQSIESYLITPFIQQRAVSFPPAFIISVQILMGVLFGPIGVLLATPLAVVAVVSVQMLYVEDTLGDSVEIVGLRNSLKLPFDLFKKNKGRKKQLNLNP